MTNVLSKSTSWQDKESCRCRSRRYESCWDNRFMLRRTCCKVGVTCGSIAPSAESRWPVTCPWTSLCLLGKRMTGKLQLHKTHESQYPLCHMLWHMLGWSMDGQALYYWRAEIVDFSQDLTSRRAFRQERTLCDRRTKPGRTPQISCSFKLFLPPRLCMAYGT